jgi:hypothetical protein
LKSQPNKIIGASPDKGHKSKSKGNGKGKKHHRPGSLAMQAATSSNEDAQYRSQGRAFKTLHQQIGDQ